VIVPCDLDEDDTVAEGIGILSEPDAIPGEQTVV